MQQHRTNLIWLASGFAGSLAFCFNFSMIPAAHAGVLDGLRAALNGIVYGENAASSDSMGPHHPDWNQPGFPGNPDAVPMPAYLTSEPAPLSTDQVATMQHLAWPQTRADMEGTFGATPYKVNGADHYRTPSGRIVRVQYQGNTATSFSGGN